MLIQQARKELEEAERLAAAAAEREEAARRQHQLTSQVARRSQPENGEGRSSSGLSRSASASQVPSSGPTYDQVQAILRWNEVRRSANTSPKLMPLSPTSSNMSDTPLSPSLSPGWASPHMTSPRLSPRTTHPLSPRAARRLERSNSAPPVEPELQLRTPPVARRSLASINTNSSNGKAPAGRPLRTRDSRGLSAGTTSPPRTPSSPLTRRSQGPALLSRTSIGEIKSEEPAQASPPQLLPPAPQHPPAASPPAATVEEESVEEEEEEEAPPEPEEEEPVVLRAPKPSASRERMKSFLADEKLNQTIFDARAQAAAVQQQREKQAAAEQQRRQEQAEARAREDRKRQEEERLRQFEAQEQVRVAQLDEEMRRLHRPQGSPPPPEPAPAAAAADPPPPETDDMQPAYDSLGRRRSSISQRTSSLRAQFLTRKQSRESPEPLPEKNPRRLPPTPRK